MVYTVLNSDLYFYLTDKLEREFDATITAAVLLDYNINVVYYDVSEKRKLHPFQRGWCIWWGNIHTYVEISPTGWLKKLTILLYDDTYKEYNFPQLEQALKDLRNLL